MDKKEQIIYSLNIEDVQTVAEQELNRKLSHEKIKIVEDQIGDYINWYDTILITMIDANIKWQNIKLEETGWV